MRGPNRFAAVDALFDEVIGPGPVLELGCGDGRILARAAARGHEVMGIDCDAAVLAKARARGVTRLVHGDAEVLPFADQCAGTVLSGFFSANLMDRERMLAEAWRVLTPGGAIAYTLLNPNTRVLDLLQHRLRSGRRPDLAGLRRHWHKLGRPAKEIARLRRHGFVPLPLRGPAFLPGLRRLDLEKPPILSGLWTELAWEVVVRGVRPYDGRGRGAPKTWEGRPVTPLGPHAALGPDTYLVALPGGDYSTGTLSHIECTARGDACILSTPEGMTPPVLRSAILGRVETGAKTA